MCEGVCYTCRVITFRLSDNDPSRLVESYSSFTATLNAMCWARFNRTIEKEEELVARQHHIPPDRFYSDVFVRKVRELCTVNYEL